MKYHYHFSGVSTIVNGEEFRFVSELESHKTAGGYECKFYFEEDFHD